ncbi:MAG: protein-L-isoaspartate O-methyltransferase [Elusimicrobia bacterium RIFOXYA2_FULL_39_19]|nr:MAG: protein-L-isoaspartate O-methyltransferase [Elusimicrobia bacterium RIFOXYA2_FULL_39_19]
MFQKTLTFLILIGFCTGNLAYSEPDYLKLRYAMVTQQLKAKGIKNKNLLKAMFKVERHKFVEDNLKQYAYENYPLSIGQGQTISQPYLIALMIQNLELKKTHKVLEIGTGSGYQTAILSELAKEVYSVEILPALKENAEFNLKNLGYSNVKLRCGDGYEGWKSHAPYDRIIVSCAVSHVPQPLLDQLANYGRIVIPVGEETQELLLIRRNGKNTTSHKISSVNFTPMTGIAETKQPQP